jgi:ribose 5-phosphate isomerase A
VNDVTDLDREQERAARYSMRFIDDGMVVGLGTGATAAHAIRMIGARVRDGHRLVGVPTSAGSAALASEHGIRLLTPDQVEAIDVTIDGADEVVPNCDALKGAGGALVRERIVAAASRLVVFIVDSSKPVARLGIRPVPFEVVPFGRSGVARRLAVLGFVPTLRLTRAGEVFLTENGNQILDAQWRHAGEALPDDDTLRRIAGVVDHGVFRGVAHHVVVGRGDRIEVLSRAL